MNTTDALCQCTEHVCRRIRRKRYRTCSACVGCVGPVLTERQATVLRLVARGLTNQQIGYELGCTRQTVSNHVREVFIRLGVPDRTSAVVAAMALDIVLPPTTVGRSTWTAS